MALRLARGSTRLSAARNRAGVRPESHTRFDHRDGLLAAALALAVIVMQRGVAALWWLDDDLFNLRWVESHGVLGQILDPAVWRQLPFRMLTPGLFLSLEADSALFGAEPSAWHLHQLVAQAALAAALYLVVRLWLGRPAALAATLLAVGSPPVLALAASIPVRHYVEGAVLALASVASWKLALRAKGPRSEAAWSLAAAAAYLGATLAKEVFVPLPGLLAALPVEERGRRWRSLAPQAAALLAYSLYRRYMLGTWSGGYGWAVALEDYPRLLWGLPGKLASAAIGPVPVLGGTLLVVEVILVLLALRRPSDFRALAVGALGIVGPLVPVATEVPTRYAAVPTLVLAVAAGVALERTHNSCPRFGNGLSAILGVAAVVSWAVVWPPILGVAKRQSLENRAFLELGQDEALRLPAAPPGTMEELALLYQRRRGVAQQAPRWFYDDVFLCRQAVGGVWEYAPALGRLQQVSPTQLLELREGCRQPPGRVPISARLGWRSGVLRWSLGPPGDGKFRLVVAGGRAVLEAPINGAFHVAERGRLGLSIRRTLKDGTTEISPELELIAESNLEWTNSGEN